MTVATELRMREPVFGELAAAVSHVFASEDPERKHLLRRELGFESRVECYPLGCVQDVRRLLHPIMHVNDGVAAPSMGVHAPSIQHACAL